MYYRDAVYKIFEYTYYYKPVRGRIVDDLWIVCRPGAEVHGGVTDRIGMDEGTSSDGSDAPAITIAQKLYN